MEQKTNSSRWTMLGAVGAALSASLCCILPVVAAALGVAGFAASAFFAAWRARSAFAAGAIALIAIRSITGTSIELFSLLFLFFCGLVLYVADQQSARSESS